MRIVVTNNVLLQVGQYVSHMQDRFDYQGFMANKNKMLQGLSQYIDKLIVKGSNTKPTTHNWYWKDGKSVGAWVFYFAILPQQQLVVIYKWTMEENIQPQKTNENKEIKNILSLMERMGMKVYKKEVQTKDGSVKFPSFLSDMEIDAMNKFPTWKRFVS